MSVVPAAFLMLLGALSLVAPAQWWRRRWSTTGIWIARTVSPHLLVAAPALGLFLIALGLTVLWSPGVIFAALAGLLFVGVILASGRRRPVVAHDLREPGERAGPADERFPPQSERRTG